MYLVTAIQSHVTAEITTRGESGHILRDGWYMSEEAHGICLKALVEVYLSLPILLDKLSRKLPPPDLYSTNHHVLHGYGDW